MYDGSVLFKFDEQCTNILAVSLDALFASPPRHFYVWSRSPTTLVHAYTLCRRRISRATRTEPWSDSINVARCRYARTPLPQLSGT